MTREWNDLLLCDIVGARAERHPDFPVLTFECIGKDDETRTYAQLWERANRLAATLIARGLERGDRFGLMMRNHPEFVETMVAASISGTVFVPIDPRTKGAKLAYTLNNAGCTGIVLGDYNLQQFEDIRGEVPQINTILALTTGEDNAPGLSDFAGADSLDVALDTAVPTPKIRLESPLDPLQIIYTSGTTGDPKGVVMNNARFGMFAGIGRMVFQFTPEDCVYTGLSLTHGNAQAVTLASALAMEIRGVFSRKFTKSRLWDICRKHGCTSFSLLGGMVTAIYSEPEKPNDGDNPVRFVTSAGMPAAIWEPFERRFNLDVFEWYGAVEGGLAFKPLGQGPVGSFGKPMPGLNMKVLDENDVECPAGVVGEICSRPETGEDAEVVYHGNPEASQAKTRGGWLRSGDMGRTDEDGWLFFEYRKGGGIRHNGDFVNPGFVEKVVAEHPGVSDVFVYGIPAKSGAPGEKDVVAAMVAMPGTTLDPQSVWDTCVKGLEGNFIPSYLQVVGEIPKTASEKPQERFLREALKVGAPGVYVRD